MQVYLIDQSAIDVSVLQEMVLKEKFDLRRNIHETSHEIDY